MALPQKKFMHFFEQRASSNTTQASLNIMEILLLSIEAPLMKFQIAQGYMGSKGPLELRAVGGVIQIVYCQLTIWLCDQLATLLETHRPSQDYQFV